tara:strand:- start:3965 stop:4141 length:177 start_codon:yes stop_codon:yes gene_type:complete
MRTLIEEHKKKRILKDVNALGFPRYIIEERGKDGRWHTAKYYSKLFTPIHKVRKFENI